MPKISKILGGVNMKQIGIKLADGTFFPILEEGKAGKKSIDLTTVQDNQTTVHVDLYRSADGTMNDAEYVDTLEIKNLKPHQNGEPNLNLDIGLDENNELSAEITDPETGKKSETQVTLVSRTLSEANRPPVDFEKDPTLSEADEQPEQNSDDTLADYVPLGDNGDESDITISPQELSKLGLNDTSEDNNVIAPSPNDEDFSFDTLNNDTKKKDTQEDTAALEEKKDDSSEEIFSEDDFDLPEFSAEDVADPDEPLDETSVDEAEVKFPETEEELELPEPESSDEKLIEDDSQPETETESEHKPAENETESFEDGQPKEENNSETAETEQLPDFDDEDEDSQNNGETSGKAFLDDGNITDWSLDDTDEVSEKESAENENDNDSLSMESVPDAEEDKEDKIEDNSSDDDFDLPDFDEEPSDTAETAEPVGLGGVFDGDFGEPDLEQTEDNPFDTSDLDLDDSDYDESKKSKDPTFQPSNNMFNDLYDKETLDGTSSAEVSDDIKKKTRVPVIICVVCAIICIIAALLVLFVIPSKINILSKMRSGEIEDAPVITELPEQKPVEQESENIPEPEPEPAPAAVEDEIVIAENPEVVVPEQPEPPAEKPQDIRYKIVWGDTLWDISEAYYKNPWRYKSLAKYNSIRNPDYIISGTWINIPAE